MKPVAPADLERFRVLVGRRLGLHCGETRAALLTGVLAARLASTRRGLDEYLDALGAEDSREEVAALAGHLTVPETHFFRQIQHQRAFEDRVLDAFAARQGAEARRILAAGCASGEEAYSIAMSLRTRFGDVLPWPVELVAIDVSRAALARAKAARYSSWALRETPDVMRERWFRRDGADWVLDPSIVAMVTFEERNLVEEDPRFWRTDRFDVVFCRNVLMYLDMETQRAVVARITASLRPRGFLFLGYAESLRGLSDAYETCNTHESFYHRRLVAPPSGPRTALAALGDDASPEPGPAWMGVIERASARVLALSDRRLDADAHGRDPARAAGERDAGNRENRDDADGSAEAFLLESWREAILELLAAERVEQASAIVEAIPPALATLPASLRLRAAVRMLRGDFAASASDCQRVLDVDANDAAAHQVLALCCEGEGDLARAVEHDRTAARLDVGFAMPRLRLGVLARRRGAFDEARRELGAALPLLATEDPARLLLFGGGFGRDALVALCRAEIAACERESP